MRTNSLRVDRAYSIILSFLIGAVGFGETAAYAQFATVQGTIQTVRRGRVADAKIETRFVAAAGAKVRNPTASQSVHSRGNGEYRIEGLQLGTYDLVVCALAYEPSSKKGLKLEEADVVTTLNFALETPPPEGGEISGQFILEDGKPASGRVIYLKDSDTGCLVLQTRADEKGNATWTGVDKTKRYNFCFDPDRDCLVEKPNKKR